jgi:RNA polymerase sigma factor (sigma-70 family)
MGRIAEPRGLIEPQPGDRPQLGLARNGGSASGADAAARVLYERYSNRIFRYCLQRLGSVEEAEDAAQTAFLYAYVGLRRGVEPEFEVAWLYKIAENVCRTRLRSHIRRGRFEATGDLFGLLELATATEPDRDEKVDALPEILAGMPASQRRALLLREVQGLSYREIAEQLQTSVSAVETLLFRARRSCVRELERLGRPAERALSLGSLAATLQSLVSRYLAPSGGAKTAAAVAAAAVSGGVIAATPQLVAGSAHRQPPTTRDRAPAAERPELAASRTAPGAPSVLRATTTAKRDGRPHNASTKNATSVSGVPRQPVDPAAPPPTPTHPAPAPATAAAAPPAATPPEPIVAPPSVPAVAVGLPPAPAVPPLPPLPQLPPAPELPPAPQLPPAPSVDLPTLP